MRRLRRCAQLRRLACPTGRHQRHFQSPQARHCRDRLNSTCKTSTPPLGTDEVFSAVIRITSRSVNSRQPALSLGASPLPVAAHARPRHFAGSGFHTGVIEPTRFSGIWRRQQTDTREDPEFGIHDTNWKSAEDDPDTVSRLIQDDIDANFVQECHRDIAQAKKRWPEGVAVGRLSVARADQREPRLCLDSTIPNVFAKVQIEEKSFNPCVEDIISAKVVTHSSEGVGLAIDVSKAHKRLRIREDEWKLFLCQHRGKLFHYTVCHFGRAF